MFSVSVQLSATLVAPIEHSPRAGRGCRCADGPPGLHPAWPAGTRASAFVSGRGYWGSSRCG